MTKELQIDVLGTFRVRQSGAEATPSAPKLRQVLALLALNVNALVSVDQFSYELWGDSPPASATTTLQTYIYQLRRRFLLAVEHDDSSLSHMYGQPVLLTRFNGYELRLGEKANIDAIRFEELTNLGKEQYRSGDLSVASSTLREALSVWRGEAMIDVAIGERLRDWSVLLEEQRRTVLELRFAIELELGRHDSLLVELAAALRTFPTHEPFAEQLMRALVYSGRRPEAMEVFRAFRTRLVEGLGVEPSAALQELHRQVLDDRGLAGGRTQLSASPSSAPAAPCPAQLPAAVPHFTGRCAQLAQIEAYLGSPPPIDGELRVVEIHGPPGVGKTALAVRAAHRVRHRFPDGQFFADLSTGDGNGENLASVLAVCLRSAGLIANGPRPGLDELGQILRTWAADRKVLIVVDDVAAAEQLHELMPGGSGCAVIATNRHRAHRLVSGLRILLNPLGRPDAGQLYRKVVKVVGENAQPDDEAGLDELLLMCGGSPLAIRAAAELLAVRPVWTVARLVHRLQRQPHLLAELPVGSQSMSRTITSSCSRLSGRHRRLLDLLAGSGRGVLKLEDICRLFTDRDAESLLEDLIDVHLVDETTGTGAGHEREGGDPRDDEFTFAVPHLIRQAVLRMRAVNKEL
jgi:DNA-binding SARP family transcriptional activator